VSEPIEGEGKTSKKLKGGKKKKNQLTDVKDEPEINRLPKKTRFDIEKTRRAY